MFFRPLAPVRPLGGFPASVVVPCGVPRHPVAAGGGGPGLAECPPTRCRPSLAIQTTRSGGFRNPGVALPASEKAFPPHRFLQKMVGVSTRSPETILAGCRLVPDRLPLPWLPVSGFPKFPKFS